MGIRERVPGIDSLKAMAKYFGVTIDELISSDAIIAIAENDTKTKIEGIKNFFIGIVDMMALLLIVLPLYPKPVEGFVYSVNLLEYSDATAFNRTMYFVLFISLMLIGIIMTVSSLIGKNKVQSTSQKCEVFLLRKLIIWKTIMLMKKIKKVQFFFNFSFV